MMETINNIVDTRKRNFFRLIGYVPLPHAIDFHNSNSQVRLILGGMRAGKSSVCVVEAAYILTFPRKNVWVVGINYDKTDRFILGESRAKGVLDYISRFPGLFKSQSKRYHLIELSNGSKIKGKSIKNLDGFVAEPVDMIICEDAYSYPDGIYEKFIRPRVIDTKGKILINSTPPLKKNWITELSNSELIEVFHFKTIENVYVDKEEIERLRQEIPEWVSRSVIDGEMPTNESAIFGNFMENVQDYQYIPYIDGHLYQAGIDIGRKKDRTVLSIVDLTDNKVVYIDRFPQELHNPDLVAERLIKGLSQYNFPITYLDVTSVGQVFTFLTEQYNFIKPFEIYTLKVRNRLIENVAIALQKGLLLPNNEDLIKELSSLDIEIKTGYYKYVTSGNGTDDIIMSIGLALHNWVDKLGSVRSGLNLRVFAEKKDTVFTIEDNLPVRMSSGFLELKGDEV